MLQLGAVALKATTGPNRSSTPENGPQDSVLPVGLVPETVRPLTVATSARKLVHGPSVSVPTTETRPTYAEASPLEFAPTVTAALTAAFKLAVPVKESPDSTRRNDVAGVPAVEA